MSNRKLPLYIIRNARTGIPVSEAGVVRTFSDKRSAKVARRQIEHVTGEEYTVSPGPAHKKFKPMIPTLGGV